MKAVITVLGKDRPGIIAEVSGALYRAGANILDITQTVLQGEIFSMVLLADLAGASMGFAQLKEALDESAARLGVEIQMQREEIFTSMHRI